jgi:hypothetical protein
MKKQLVFNIKSTNPNFLPICPNISVGLGWGKHLIMKKTYALLLLLISIGAAAQSECTNKLETIQKVLESDALYKNYEKMFNDLLPCAEEGELLALNYVGLFYLDGLGVEKDEIKGFENIEKAAENGNAIAQNNLGSLYREGKGCMLNMEKAVYWYEQAADQNNARAAYSLGYMYLKGFGVPQNYATAVSWFEKSDYEMAKHWLGVCYYLGYGVSQDIEKAVGYLSANDTSNSKAFLINLKLEKNEVVLNQANQAIEEASEGIKKIDPEVIEKSRETINAEAIVQHDITTNDLLGEWTGRFIEYDWSGKLPLRVLPIDVTFSKDDKGELHTSISFDGKLYENTAVFEYNNLCIPGFKFNLEQLYSHSFINYKLDYTVIGMDLTQKNYNKVPYLIVDVDSFISLWREPGAPISLVLRPKSEFTISSEEDEAMLVLASQQTAFIKVYPVPFNEQLYIGFDLINPAQVQVNLTSVATAASTLVANTDLQSGMQSFTINTANLPKGYYVIRVQENDKLHTRIVLKQ